MEAWVYGHFRFSRRRDEENECEFRHEEGIYPCMAKDGSVGKVFFSQIWGSDFNIQNNLCFGGAGKEYVVATAFNPNTGKAKTNGFLWPSGWPP